MDSAVDADAAVNVWHFAHVGELTDASAVSLTAAFKTFYNAWIVSFGSRFLTTGTSDDHEIQYASLEPGGAGREDDVVSKVLFRKMFSIPNAPTGVPLPSECAVVLSFRSDLTGFPNEAEGGATRPASRRRGRVYLGPFCIDAAASDSLGQGTIVTDNVPLNITNAYVAFIASVNLITQTMTHSIYSPTNGTATTVVAAWVDNAWDTVRRRGTPATGRVTRTVTQGGA